MPAFPPGVLLMSTSDMAAKPRSDLLTAQLRVSPKMKLALCYGHQACLSFEDAPQVLAAGDALDRLFCDSRQDKVNGATGLLTADDVGFIPVADYQSL